MFDALRLIYVRHDSMVLNKGPEELRPLALSKLHQSGLCCLRRTPYYVLQSRLQIFLGHQFLRPSLI